jgi:hypothetical protein
MLRSLVLCFAVLAAVAPGVASAGSTPATARPAATAEGWPDTRAGRMAAGWVAAFSAGEDSMKAFNAAHLTAEALARRSPEQRVVSYRSLHERLGTLMLVRVDKATEEKIEATLMASDASPHRFVFRVQGEAPYRLISVGMMETVPGHGFGH